MPRQPCSTPHKIPVSYPWYLFGKSDASGKLLAERLYFDNETVMKQISGEIEPANVKEFGGS